MNKANPLPVGGLCFSRGRKQTINKGPNKCKCCQVVISAVRKDKLKREHRGWRGGGYVMGEGLPNKLP